MWIIPDSDRAERAALFTLKGEFPAPFSDRPQGRTLSVGFTEYDPALF